MSSSLWGTPTACPSMHEASMHLWGPKTLLTWTEPKLARETREALEKQDASWLGQIGWAILVGFVILLRVGVRLGRRNNWPVILLVVLVAALAIIYLLPRVKALFPSIIHLTENAVKQHVANRVTSWKLSELASFRLIVPEGGGA